MILVTIELLPGGSPENKRHLGTMEIWNTIEESYATEGRRGTYRFQLWKKRHGRPVFQGRVRNYPRNAYSVWELVRRILEIAHKEGRL